MTSVEAIKELSLERAISNLKEQSKKDGRFFEIVEKASSKTYADAIIEIMALNDHRRNNVCLQDRTLFMRNYHSDNTLAKRCKRILQDRNRIVAGMTQKTQEMKSQFGTFMNSKKKINQMSVDHIELGKSKYMPNATPHFVPQSDIFYLSRKNKIQRRTMANPEHVSALLSRARTMLQKSDLEKLNQRRKTKSARFVEKEETPRSDDEASKRSDNDDNSEQSDDDQEEYSHTNKEQIDFNESFYFSTGIVPENNREDNDYDDEKPAVQTSVTFEKSSISGRSASHENAKQSDIKEKMRMFYQKMNHMESSGDTMARDSPAYSDYPIYDLPKMSSQMRKKRTPEDNEKLLSLPPLPATSKEPLTHSNCLEESFNRVPLTSLSQVRIVPPSMSILDEEIKREEAVNFPHSSSDRCAIRIAMCRDSRPIADKLQSVTSTRDIMLIRNMLESKRELIAMREERMKKYQKKEKQVKK